MRGLRQWGRSRLQKRGQLWGEGLVGEVIEGEQQRGGGLRLAPHRGRLGAKQQGDWCGLEAKQQGDRGREIPQE